MSEAKREGKTAPHTLEVEQTKLSKPELSRQNYPSQNYPDKTIQAISTAFHNNSEMFVVSRKTLLLHFFFFFFRQMACLTDGLKFSHKASPYDGDERKKCKKGNGGVGMGQLP